MLPWSIVSFHLPLAKVEKQYNPVSLTAAPHFPVLCGLGENFRFFFQLDSNIFLSEADSSHQVKHLPQKGTPGSKQAGTFENDRL